MLATQKQIMKKIISALFLATLLLTACKSSKEVASKTEETVKEVAAVESWIIASKKVACNDADGVATTCYNVKKAGDREYVPMNVSIEGFEFEEGYKYQIEIKVIPSKKGDTRYVYVKQIHKIMSK